MRVLVAHPGIQHSHHLACALHQAGDLLIYLSGMPISDRPRLKRLWRRHLRVIPIPSSHRDCLVIIPVLRRLATILLPSQLSTPVNYALDRVFDWWVSRLVAKVKPDMVVCYESSALRTFLAAKRVGALCVLDAASVHYATGRQWGGEAVKIDTASVIERKQQEIDLADAILTCSRLAAETFTQGGVAATRVFTVALGASSPNDLVRPSTANPAVLKVLYAGNLTTTKGADLLLQAFQQFEAERAPIQLTIVGGRGMSELERITNTMSNVTRKPFLAQNELFKEYASHDVLVLPSRLDSFGMVVPEAMTVGTPVIVTDRVGSKCIVEDYPGSGWVVECSASSIKEAIARVAGNREELARASACAKRATLDYTWAAYQQRVISTLRAIYDHPRA